VTSATAITKRVIGALNLAGIPHMLVGAFSRNAYAPPRSTQDADVVVALTGHSLRVVAEGLGADFSLEGQTSFETNTGTLRDTLIHKEAHFSIELFHLSQDAHDQERFGRRRATSFDGEPTCIPTPEDVIITKLRWARRKDMDDVRDILRFVEPGALDWNYLHRWTVLHGTRETLDTIRAERNIT
jgi:predicted nucleotidyltransferase